MQPCLCILFVYIALASLKVLSGTILVTVKINNPYILRKIAFIRVIGLSRENSAIRYAALVLAIVLVGSVLVSGLAAAKTPVSGTTHKVLLKDKNPQVVAKNPNPATKAIVLKPTAKTKVTIKPTVKATAVKRKP